MAIIPMKALLESGVHFGHRTNKWDPRMKPYIFTERNGIHIIDLQQTVKLLNQAYSVIRDTVSNGGTILFVGTKRQAQETITDEATRCGMPFVTERWLGGTLTNWSTIYQRVQELERLEKMRDSGEINHLTKKEGLLIEREIGRLERRLSGVRHMKRLPQLLFIVDVCREYAAVHEANLLNIPIIAMVDTNCNPLDIDYVIPSNDDAIRAIKLLVSKIADAVLEGDAVRKEDIEAEMESAQPLTERPVSVKTTRVVDEDDQDIEEEELLGEATLAKLNVSRKPAEEEIEEEIEETVEEVEQIEVAEKSEEPGSELPEAIAADSEEEIEVAEEAEGSEQLDSQPTEELEVEEEIEQSEEPGSELPEAIAADSEEEIEVAEEAEGSEQLDSQPAEELEVEEEIEQSDDPASKLPQDVEAEEVIVKNEAIEEPEKETPDTAEKAK
jgi:small subunit ribosomal protein S2